MPLLLSMLVERRVSPGDHVLDGVSGPQFGQPKADRSVSGACGENGVDATHPLRRLGAVESWQRTNELVAAISNDQVVGAQLPCQSLCDLDEHLVTARVAVRIIDCLEVVHVHVCHHDWLSAPARARYVASLLRKACAAEVGASEIVV